MACNPESWMVWALYALSDRIGRYLALMVMMVCTSIDLFFYMGNATSFLSFALALCVVQACHGGVVVVFPSLCGDVFGQRYFGSNYALLLPPIPRLRLSVHR